MRSRRICPKCQGRSFYVLQPARMPDGQTANGTLPIALAAEYKSKGQARFLSDPHEMIAAEVDSWVCAHCGFAELYARDVRVLAYLASTGSPHVKFVTG
jgi:predicted nucleic-acid-binding Zn-ribbon protein